jgi:two-component sensor histidine kinase
VESGTLSEAKQALETRLAVLARAHAMLADSGWRGAPLDQIVCEELTSFASQISCTGCDLTLNTPAAQAFALIIHELATNAVKHGALSRPEGHVAIQGRMQSDGANNSFRFVWIETGGPAVALPQRRGFGSSILSGMANRFAKIVEMNYRPEGFTYELQVSLASISASPKTKSISDSTSNAASGQRAELDQGQTRAAAACAQ